MTSARALAALYGHSHDLMRNLDGLQPQEAFDELLKYLYLKEKCEELGENGRMRGSMSSISDATASRRVKKLRQLFRRFLKANGDSAWQLWPSCKINLSDGCLDRIDQLFDPIQFKELDVDTRSAALREFLHADIRKGLGIFLTPDSVVRAVVECIAPDHKENVLDPACGSGTFLAETLTYWNRRGPIANGPVSIFGVDKNPRMLMLAELNLADQPNVNFVRSLADSISVAGRLRAASKMPENGFDVVLTNPPFGVYVDPTSDGYLTHESTKSASGTLFGRQQSEAIFLEQCLRLLRPGGRLAIVLPRSVVTNQNERLQRARGVAASIGFVEALVSLPPETFYRTGTQTNTVVVVARRYRSADESAESHRVAYVKVSNVGFDATGRARAGDELPEIAAELAMLRGGSERTAHGYLGEVGAKSSSFDSVPEAIVGSRRRGSGSAGQLRLGDIVELVRTGRTPARAAYTDSGLFVVKVGNLTGAGIDWLARDRNFVSESEANRRRKSDLMLQENDIVLTSSAHSPVYIAKKVDLVSTIPSWVGGAASFVGEVMLVRPNPSLIDPLALLAFLRVPLVQEQLQSLVRGQTAHLHPDDVKEIVVPSHFIESSSAVRRVVALIQQETQLNSQMNELAREQAIARTALDV